MPICVCPCGHTLSDDGKTCIDNQECPFDISLWLDGTTSACASAGYDDAQRATMANIADFFNVEVRKTIRSFSDWKIGKFFIEFH